MCIIISILKFLNKEEVLEWFFEFEFRTLGPKLEREYLKPVTISSHAVKHCHLFSHKKNCGEKKYQVNFPEETEIVQRCRSRTMFYYSPLYDKHAG